jgi:hypothetical protein
VILKELGVAQEKLVPIFDFRKKAGTTNLTNRTNGRRKNRRIEQLNDL